MMRIVLDYLIDNNSTYSCQKNTDKVATDVHNKSFMLEDGDICSIRVIIEF